MSDHIKELLSGNIVHDVHYHAITIVTDPNYVLQFLTFIVMYLHKVYICTRKYIITDLSSLLS